MKRHIQSAKELAVRNFIPMTRYFIVGGIAFAVDFGLIYFLTDLYNMYYLTSAALGFCAGLVVNYTLSILWVFDNRKLDSRRMEFIIFGIIGILGLGMNHGIMWFSTDIIGIHYLISKVISQGIIFVFNYGSRKILLF